MDVDSCIGLDCIQRGLKMLEINVDALAARLAPFCELQSSCKSARGAPQPGNGH